MSRQNNHHYNHHHHHHHHHNHYPNHHYCQKYIIGIIIIIIGNLVHSNRTSSDWNKNSPTDSSPSPPLLPQPSTLIDSLANQFSNLKLSQNIATESVSVSQRIIQTKYGSIRGSIVKLTSSNNNRPSSYPTSSQVSSFLNLPDVETYLGVPYATPPTGGLRFMPPVTPTHWRGVRLVNRLRPVCPQQIPQRDYRAILSRNETEALRWMPRARYEYLRRLIPMLGNQSEDCLYLNIYVPSSSTNSIRSSENNNQRQTNNNNKGYPVLVLLHGESYDWHSGNIFDGSILSSYGQVIVVTVNYRLGILGFLPAFTDGTVRGNYGLMDQVAALHWIQENIGEFGGSSSNITLIGHGHGAACAHLLMLSPMAKGLFNRVILMSGSALSPWAIARDPEHYAQLLGRNLNCTNLETMIDCLRTRKIGQLIAQYEHLAPEHLTAFGPIIDSIVVPFDPVHLYQTELYHSSSPSTNDSDYGDSNSSLSKHSKDSKKNQTISNSNAFNNFAGFDPLSLAKSYDLMVGITDADSPCLFSDQESQFGVEPERRDRILRTLVRNLYDFHQQAIFLILYNEYSAWSSNNPTPSISSKRSFDILDSATSMLSDALVFSPLVKVVDAHSESEWKHQASHSLSSGRVFFYKLDTNQASQESLYNSDSRYMPLYQEQQQQQPQQHRLPPSKRVICSIGHDLAFLFGDPIAHLQLGVNSQVGPFYYPVNLTGTHQIVSELFMQYIINFARNGDPNSRSSHFVASSSNPTSRISVQNTLTQRHYWPRYDSKQKTYLNLGSTAPKPLDHQKNRRLSLWLNLIPRLLIDDQDFFQTNFGANLTDTKKNHLTRYYYYSRKSFQNFVSNRSQYMLNQDGSGGHRNDLAETSKHVAGSMAMASEPYSSQQQQQQEQQKHLYRQHHLLVDYDNPKSYDGIVRTFSNNTNLLNQNMTNNSLNNDFNSDSSNQSNQSNNDNNSSLLSTVWHIWNNVTHNPINVSNENLDHILQSRYEPNIGNSINLNNNQQNDSSTWWLMIIGAACALLFFINVIFFITLFYQLKKNRKITIDSSEKKSTQESKLSEIQSIQSKIVTTNDEGRLNHSPVFCHTTTTSSNTMQQTHTLIDPDDLMIQLHSSNTLNRKHNNNNSRHAVNSYTEMYESSGSGVVSANRIQPSQSISYQLASSNNANTNTFNRNNNKTITFAGSSNSSNILQKAKLHQPPPVPPTSSHTILLNDPSNMNLVGNNNPVDNYVPFLTTTTTNTANHDPSDPSSSSISTSTHHHQPTTYYCLQVNPNENNAHPNIEDFDSNNSNNLDTDHTMMIANNSEGYREMPV